jgi:hypothetical protein
MIQALRPIPAITRLWGYDHLPNQYKKPCPPWAVALSTPASTSTEWAKIVPGLLQLVSGAETIKKEMVFSRAPDSWISLDEFSIGFPHWWSETAPEILEKIADTLPQLTAHAWGAEVAKQMTSLAWIKKQITVRRGKGPHKAKYDWLVSGWWEIALHPKVVDLCVKHWLESYPVAAANLMLAEGYKEATTFAAFTRIANSVGAGGLASLVRKATVACSTNPKSSIGNPFKYSEKNVLNKLFEEEYYGHGDRLVTIRAMDNFQGVIRPETFSQAMVKMRLNYPIEKVVRVDGSKPEWHTKGDF